MGQRRSPAKGRDASGIHRRYDASSPQVRCKPLRPTLCSSWQVPRSGTRMADVQHRGGMTLTRGGHSPGMDFRERLLILRGRSGLSQRKLADLVGVSVRAVQAWEAGLSYPEATHLQRLIALYVRCGVFEFGRESEDALALWEVAQEETSRQRPPFDHAWFAEILANLTVVGQERAMPLPSAVRRGPRARDWGEAPEVNALHGRTMELGLLTNWTSNDSVRLVAILGI